MVEKAYMRSGIVQRSLERLVRLAIAFPWLTMLVAIALAIAALWYTATCLEFATSRNALVPSQSRFMKNYRLAKEDFGDLDNVIVVVEPTHLEQGKRFVDALVKRVQNDTQHFTDVTGKLDTTSLEGKKLLLLSSQELHTLRHRLTEAQELLTDVTAAPGLQTLLTAVNRDISSALVSHLTSTFLETSSSSDRKDDDATPPLAISFLTTLFTNMEQALAQPSAFIFRSPWADFFLKGSKVLAEEGYLTAQNDRFLFVLVTNRSMGRGFVKHAAPLTALRAHIQALREDFPGVQAGVTGGAALATDEMLASQRDTLAASIIALLGVAVLFIVTFRERLRPLLVITTLVTAICWTLGITTLCIGRLNILSVTFTPILIGLGIDFGIHFLARYAEERARGVHFRMALTITCHHTGTSLLAAALTTALAFYAMLLVDFPGLAELGFITGSGVLLCFLAACTVLPALLALSEGKRQVQPGIWQTVPPDPLRYLKRAPRLSLGLLGLLSLIGVVLLPWPRFDYNLLNLQAQGTESVVWEYRLLKGSGRSSWYATSVATSLDELYRKKVAFAALPAVERVESLAALLPVDQTERLTLVHAMAPLVEPFAMAPQTLQPITVDALQRVLEKIRFKLQRPDTAWKPNKRPSIQALEAARAALIRVQERLQMTPAAVAQQALETFQQALMTDFANKLALLQHNVQPAGPLTLDDVPPTLRQRFTGHSGRYLLQIFARENIWERQPMETFVAQLETVDPDVTGAPIVGFYSIRLMQQGYTSSGLYAFVVIVVITLVLFRRLMPTLLALIPLVLGAVWTLLAMAGFEVHFNMANLIVLPLFLGIAIDSGIHLVHRAMEQPEAATVPMARSTGKAVLLSSLTTMVGFASLLVARHVGIFSLGLLSTLAIGSSLVAAFLVMPLIFHLFSPHTSPPRTIPTMASSGTSYTSEV